MRGFLKTLLRVLDTAVVFLTRPRVRRVRRWSFLLTVPAGVLAGRALGIEPTLGNGLLAGVAVALLDVVVVVGVAVLGTRLLGRERRDVLLDLVMHPVARRAIRGELRMLWTFARAFTRRGGRRRRGVEFSYHRGSAELGLALALVPAALAEGLAVHLLLPDAWLWPKVVLAVLHVYGMVMLVSWALGSRAHPHRVAEGVLEVRLGQLYRAAIPLERITRAELLPRRSGQRAGLVLDGDGEARLAANGRVDVRLHLRELVEVERPLGDPVAVTTLSVAVDDPRRLLDALAAAPNPDPASATGSKPRRALLGWLAPADLLEAATA